MTSRGRPVPEDHALLRLPRPPKDFVPARWRPTHVEFEPTTPEKAIAAATNSEIRISVWDEQITTIEQARAHRATEALLVLRGPVRGVRECGYVVTYDPLPSPESERPGAAGHAAIEGVGRAHGEAKTAWRARLQQLADTFELVAT